MNKNTLTKIKEKTKEKKVLWEGFKKELPWILFWIALALMAYGYYQDKVICDQVLSDSCDACYRLNITETNLDQTELVINQSLFDVEDNNPNTKKTILDYEKQFEKEQGE